MSNLYTLPIHQVSSVYPFESWSLRKRPPPPPNAHHFMLTLYSVRVELHRLILANYTDCFSYLATNYMQYADSPKFRTYLCHYLQQILLFSKHKTQCCENDIMFIITNDDNFHVILILFALSSFVIINNKTQWQTKAVLPTPWQCCVARWLSVMWFGRGWVRAATQWWLGVDSTSADPLEKAESEEEEEEASQKAAPAAELTPEEIARRLEEQRKEHDREKFIREWGPRKGRSRHKTTWVIKTSRYDVWRWLCSVLALSCIAHSTFCYRNKTFQSGSLWNGFTAMKMIVGEPRGHALLQLLLFVLNFDVRNSRLLFVRANEHRRQM